ncbi:MAG: hypothetical protein SFU99_10640 [Saprospiraceae bacterium]|nr:hypothetical protein [Saprospiraceae bacterium]
MNPILDEIENKNMSRITFSKLSFGVSIITTFLVIYLIGQIPSTIKVSEGIPQPPMFIVAATNIFCIVGLLFTILSFVKREPSRLFKWMGGILNIILFIFILGSILFARLI